jgi:Fe-S-cluster containining protein
MVVCYPFEVFPLAAFLATRPAIELDAILSTFRARLYLPLTPAARYGAQFPCPLLAGNRCLAYDHRPMTCRSLYSRSRRECDSALAGVEIPLHYLADPQVMAAALNQGIACALHNKRALDVEPVEMGGALHVLADHFDEAFSLWARGGSPFSAYRVRAPNIPSQAELCDVLIARLCL